MESVKKTYNNQYEKWMPWIEDMYLYYFTKDNKASYATKQNLDKTKVTGVDQIDNVQDGMNNMVAGQFGQGGIAQPIGDLASKEGVNRAERQGKDDKGGYLPEEGGVLSKGGNTVVGTVSQGSQQVAGAAQSGLKSAGGMLGFGGSKKETEN